MEDELTSCSGNRFQDLGPGGLDAADVQAAFAGVEELSLSDTLLTWDEVCFQLGT